MSAANSDASFDTDDSYTDDQSTPEDFDPDADYTEDKPLLERISTAVIIAIFGVALIGAGFALDYVGFDTWGGVTGALAVVLLAVALLTQLFIWGSARL